MRTVDMHCDTISAMLNRKRNGEAVSFADNDLHVDLSKLKKGDYLLQNFALFVNLDACEDPWMEAEELAALYGQLLKQHEADIAPVYTYGDIEQNSQAGKISAMLTVEEGGVCGGDLGKLRKLYEMGVRMLTLSWNYPNELGFPNLNSRKGMKLRETCKENPSETNMRTVTQYLNTPNEKDGLTETGIAFVQEMEALGMIVDVSHLSDAGFYDVLSHTSKPFVASHSNARSICPCVRNLTDEMIKALAERGGVTGLNFCADFLTQLPPGQHNPGTIEAMVRHAKHMVLVGGIECLGLGSDFDGIDTHEELPGADCMERLWEALKKGGFTESETEKIFSGNVLRVYKETLG